MAAALVLPTNVNVGEDIAISGTGFATGHAFTTTVTSRDNNTVVAAGTTSGGGAATGPTVTPTHPGKVHVSMSDGTSTVTGTVTVWKVF